MHRMQSRASLEETFLGGRGVGTTLQQSKYTTVKHFIVFSVFSDISMQLRYEEKRSPTNDDRNDSKRKGGQVRFSHVQSVELERIFSLQKYISPQERKQLSRFLQLSERQVNNFSIAQCLYSNSNQQNSCLICKRIVRKYLSIFQVYITQFSMALQLLRHHFIARSHAGFGTS